MDPPKSEIILLNWEISHLTSKMTNYGILYNGFDCKTIDALEALVTVINQFIDNKNLVPYQKLGPEDELVLKNYKFQHTINCKHCERTVKTSKRALINHLTEHKNISFGKTKEVKPVMANTVLTDKKLVQKVSPMPSKEKPISVTPSSSSKTPSEPEGPKRKPHQINRTEDTECLKIGDLPDFPHPLTKKVQKFINNYKPQDFIKSQLPICKGIMKSAVHTKIVQELEKLFQSTFPTIKAHPFGSRVTGLGTEKSDLDLYLDLNESYYTEKPLSPEKLKNVVLLVKEVLERSKQWSNLEAVTAARTPILRAFNIKEKIDCDISFTHGLSHCNTLLLNYMFDLQPVCYQVTIYIKQWAEKANIAYLNGYALALLVIFYFQYRKQLPSVYDIQKNCEKPALITYWQANFEYKLLEDLNISQLEENAVNTYVIGFFNFYGNMFDLETHAVCPFLGFAPMKHELKPFLDNYRRQLHRLNDYYKQLERSSAHEIRDIFSYAKPMVIQDPFELIHNVAKRLKPLDVSKFRRFCKETFVLLSTQITLGGKQPVDSAVRIE